MGSTDEILHIPSSLESIKVPENHSAKRHAFH